MSNEELTKIAWTRELTDERVRIAAAYWLDCSPHERTEADGIILARYARMAMEQIESLKAITELAVKSLEKVRDRYAGEYGGHICETEMREIANSTLSEIERLKNAQT